MRCFSHSRSHARSNPAAISGLSLATLRRLERGELDNPPLRYLQNLAIVLDVDLDTTLTALTHAA